MGGHLTRMLHHVACIHPPNDCKRGLVAHHVEGFYNRPRGGLQDKGILRYSLSGYFRLLQESMLLAFCISSVIMLAPLVTSN